MTPRAIALIIAAGVMIGGAYANGPKNGMHARTDSPMQTQTKSQHQYRKKKGM